MTILNAVFQALPSSNATHTDRFEVESMSGRRYIVAASRRTKRYECSCPAWKFKKGGRNVNRGCKHLRAMREESYI